MQLKVTTFALIFVCALVPGVFGQEQQKNPHNRLRQIALTFVESYETVRRFEHYAAAKEGVGKDITTDDKYYEQIFNSTSLDVHGAMVAEDWREASFSGVSFFRVYAPFVNPPHPEYVVGVKSNGAVFRLRGFGKMDFDVMIDTANITEVLGLHGVLRLYYSLHSRLRPGIILEEKEMKRARKTLLKIGAVEDAARLFLPVVKESQNVYVIRTCVFDKVSTRLELHTLRVEKNGAIEILEVEILRDLARATL